MPQLYILNWYRFYYLCWKQYIWQVFSSWRTYTQHTQLFSHFFFRRKVLVSDLTLFSFHRKNMNWKIKCCRFLMLKGIINVNNWLTHTQSMCTESLLPWSPCDTEFSSFFFCCILCWLTWFSFLVIWSVWWCWCLCAKLFKK